VRSQADRRPDLAHLARLEHDLLRDIVALVEQAERGDTLGHRSRPVSAGLGRSGGAGGSGGRIVEWDALRFRRAAIVARSDARDARQQRGKAGEPHRAYRASVLPGVHAS
jgi:hypothetical protein